MHKAKAFFYVCAGLFLLALSYHLGARSATAQAGTGTVATAVLGGPFGVPSTVTVFTTNGDAYGFSAGQWIYHSNVFAGGPTPAQRESFGALKSRYRGERGGAQPTTQDR